MTATYWGEEREPDALYAVYLRKVRYQSPHSLKNCHGGAKSYNISNGTTSDIYDDYGNRTKQQTDHLQWETVKERVLKAGTLPKLVSALISDQNCVDSRHFNAFFATFRAFSTPKDVLKTILDEIFVTLSEEKTNNSAGRVRCWINVLSWWLDLYPDDFQDHPNYDCLTHLIEFTRIQQGLFEELLYKCIEKRDDFSRILLSQNDTQLALDKLVLSSPVDVIDIYKYARHVTKMPGVAHVDPNYIAEQLTYHDAEIFKRLLPHQCQSCFWSKRHKRKKESLKTQDDNNSGDDVSSYNNDENGSRPSSSSNSDDVHTVKATVDQFNTVSRRVMSTVVNTANLKPHQRAKIIGAWIDIAQELRFMKNFSSLKAVLSGLQSEPVYRLRNAWNLIPSEKVRDFNDLSRLFSDDDNNNGARALLEKEGTAKSVYSNNSTVCTMTNDRQDSTSRKKLLKYKRSKSDANEIQGTVPYLGTFLTDLTMIDVANPDFIEDQLINFEKRRKEFEIIAQLKLFQSAARNYRLMSDARFRIWFSTLPDLSEDECYQMSCLIESPLRETRSRSREKKSTLSRLFNFRDESPSTGSIIAQDDIDRKVQIKKYSAPAVYGHKSNDQLFSSKIDNRLLYHLNNGDLMKQAKTSYDLGRFCTENGPKIKTSSSDYCNMNENEAKMRKKQQMFMKTSQFDVESFWNDYYQRGLIINGKKTSTPISANSPLFKDSGIIISPIPNKSNETGSFGYNDASATSGDSPLSLIERQSSSSTSGASHGKSFSFDDHCPKYKPPMLAPHSDLRKKATLRNRLLGDSGSVVNNNDEILVIKVGLDDRLQVDSSSTTVYKSVKLGNNDKTLKLIERALNKHHISEPASSFEIVQILPDKDELLLPERANAYYAVNKNVKELSFVLRPKLSKNQTSSNSSSDAQSPTVDRTVKMEKQKHGGMLLRWSSGLL